MSIIQPDDDGGYVLVPGVTIPGVADWFNVETPAAVARIEEAWADAPTDNLDRCGLIFDTAREQVIAYAPAPGPEGYPRRMAYAQLQQARNLWLAGRTDANGDMGGDFSYTPRPLDKTIRNIIRPVQGAVSVL